ncbi:hypothetical protein CEXT_240611 [Caerostris extrusa]|uniref:Uncharacterized protein n=1 Tax=Caerostris extrusa TaxID=172846 RepID=A0AAV4QFU8_CAEEX|nr:hypothetical protein CEXT_240611 [Caerostris extrusa]
MAEERRVSVTSASQQAVGVGNADYSAISFCFRREGNFSSGRLEDREMDVIGFGRWDHPSECVGIGELPPPTFCSGKGRDKTRQRVEGYKSLPETLILDTLHYGRRKKCLTPQHQQADGVKILIIQRFRFASGV